MKELTLRRIWNTVLLFSFLVVAGIGVAMALMIDFDMYPSWYAKVLDFHIDVGIIMATVTTIHVIERAWFFDIRKWNLFNK